MKIRRDLFCIALLAAATLARAGPTAKPVASEFANKPVALVADDWCPQHCEFDRKHKGYIVDIVGQALAEEGLAFTIVYRPWTRALRMTELGTYDGLLTPTAEGYPQFQFHHEAVGFQQYCFYVNADSAWSYSAPKDLLGQRVAYLRESGFGKLETYMAAHQSAIKVEEFASGRDFIPRIFKFLAAGRADTIIMTTDVYQAGVRSGATARTFKSAGCLNNEKLMVGLSRANPERARLIGEKLDSGIRKLRQSGRLKSILAEYGIALWPAQER
jgi:polar amino acid transport system substrate-binding protein